MVGFNTVMMMWRLVLSVVIFTIVRGDYTAIPASVLYKMRNVHTAEDFVRMFHRPASPTGPDYSDEADNWYPISPPDPDIHVIPVGPPGIPGAPGFPSAGHGGRPFIPDNSGGGSDEVEYDDPFGMIAVLPVCSPRPTPVEIPKDPDPYVYIWPPCVELHRCGGCCNNELFSCQATATNNLKVKVYKTRYKPNNNPDALPVERIETFTMTNETRCECDCKVKARHCNLGIHRHENCQCICIQPQIKTCIMRKVWDDSVCSCVCRMPYNGGRPCSKKRVWNDRTCRCERDCKRTATTCNTGFRWSPMKCSCERVKVIASAARCQLKDCQPGFYFDPEECQCNRLFSNSPGPRDPVLVEGGPLPNDFMRIIDRPDTSK